MVEVSTTSFSSASFYARKTRISSPTAKESASLAVAMPSLMDRAHVRLVLFASVRVKVAAKCRKLKRTRIGSFEAQEPVSMIRVMFVLSPITEDVIDIYRIDW